MEAPIDPRIYETISRMDKRDDDTYVQWQDVRPLIVMLMSTIVALEQRIAKLDLSHSKPCDTRLGE